MALSPHQKQRNAEVELLRFWAALSVCAYHARIFSGGLLAVDFFCVLSGALLTRSLVLSPHAEQRTLITYIQRQIKSLYPELCIVVLVSLIPYVFVRSAPLPHVVSTIVNDLCFLRMTGLTDPAGGACPPTWYLSSIFISSILIYPIITRIKSPLALLSLALIPLVYLICNAGGMEDNWYAERYGIIYGGNYRAIGDMLLGSAVAHAAKHIRKSEFVEAGAWMMALLKWIGVVGMSVLFVHRFRPFDPLILLFSTLCLTIIFVHIDDSYRNGVLSSICLLLGRLSLPLYLSHWLVVRTIAKYVKDIPMVYHNHLFYPCQVLLVMMATYLTYRGGIIIRRTIQSRFFSS